MQNLFLSRFRIEKKKVANYFDEEEIEVWKREKEKDIRGIQDWTKTSHRSIKRSSLFD